MKKYILGLYENAMPQELSWIEKFDIAKRYNYDFVELIIDETEHRLSRLDMSYADRVKLLNTIVESQVYMHTMSLSGHRKYPLGSLDALTVQRSLDIMKKALEFSQHIGIKIIQLVGYDVYYEKSDERTREKFIENLSICCNLAAKHGVILAFETMETDFMNTVKKAMLYVEHINSPYLQIYPDIGNLTNAAEKYAGNVLEDLCYGKGHIVAMHLKETLPDRFKDIAFGTGHVAFEDAIYTAWRLGVRCFVTELWKNDENWEQNIAQASNMMQKILEIQG